MLPDKEIIQRAQQGDRAAFSEVVDNCYDTLFRFAMKYTAQRADAEDITHQACIKLGQSIHTYRFEAKFSSWLYQLVLNCARDWHRKQQPELRRGMQRNKLDIEELEQLGATINEDRIAENPKPENLIQLRQILEQVSSYGGEFLDTLVLVVGEGMSHAEAASLLDVKESTVSWRIHEIRKRLANEDGYGGA